MSLVLTSWTPELVLLGEICMVFNLCQLIVKQNLLVEMLQEPYLNGVENRSDWSSVCFLQHGAKANEY